MLDLSFTKSKNFILSFPRLAKRLVALTLDLALIVLSVWVAFYLRLGEWVSPYSIEWQPFSAVFLSVLVAVPIFIISGLYRTIFRFSGLPVLFVLMRAVGAYGLIYASFITAVGMAGVPRTIGLIQPILLMLFIGATRIFVAYVLGDEYRKKLKQEQFSKVLIYGAGSTGRELAGALGQNSRMQVLGFLDDDPALWGNTINGYRIYSPAKLSWLIKKFDVTDVLLALPSTTRKRRNEIIDDVQKHKLHVRTLPSMTDLARGKITVGDIRELDIEDLLGRDTADINPTLLRNNILDKTVLVTGAGGSIGSEICRQILLLKPSKLVLYEQGEFNLYQIHQELLQHLERINYSVELVPVLGSVRDDNRIRQTLAKENPHTIYHAAAYKHVPLVEKNPIEGILNNVFGTLIVALAALEQGVKSFTLISTDKAVRPTNVMGASKRLAEMILQALSKKSFDDNNGNSKTIFSMVRFGNVLDSSGSVVPRFKKQIEEGGPVTVTHADVTRYFMTIPEASQLVIQSSAMATGGDVFLLDMGEPVKILSLAHRVIELSGLTVCDENNPDGDIEIAITGLRPGEKLYEELLIADNPQKTDNKKIMKAHEDFLAWEILRDKLVLLQKHCNDHELDQIELDLVHLVTGYAPDKREFI